MSRIDAQAKLFQITQTTGMLYSTAVHSTCGTIVKQPSPAIATTGCRAPQACAERTAAPKPCRRSPRVEHLLRRRAFQYCSTNCDDADVAGDSTLAVVGSTAWQSATMRSGGSRVAWDVEVRLVKASHSSHQPLISACQAFSAPPRAAYGARVREQLAQKVRASAMMADRGIVSTELFRVDIDVNELACGKFTNSPAATTKPNGHRSARRPRSRRRA